MKRLIPLILIMSLSACTCNTSGVDVKSDGTVHVTENLLEGVDVEAKLRAKSDILPNMCELMPKSFIAEVLGLEESALTPRNSTPSGGNPTHRTCFFKWEDPNFPNTGIMLQAMRNPVGDEMPEYITTFMTSKKQNGENALGDDFVHYYKDIDGIAEEGIYNADIGKYFFRFSDQVILHLAFNSIHEQEEQLQIATKLAKRMTKEYMEL